MDNATAEYSFIRQFFNPSDNRPEKSRIEASSTNNLTRIGEGSEDIPDSASVAQRSQSSASVSILTMQKEAAKRKKEEDAIYDEIWKQIMDPVLQYTDVGISEKGSERSMISVNRHLSSLF
jgi:hypothetical protein